MKRIQAFIVCLAAYVGVASSVDGPSRIDDVMKRILWRQEEELDPKKRERHENCGNTLVQANPPSSCNDTAWTELFEACLSCALEFNIWQFYGDDVTGAAKACELDATPKEPQDDKVSGSEDSSSPSSTDQSEDKPEEETASASSTPSSNSNPEGMGIQNRPAGIIMLTVGATPALVL